MIMRTAALRPLAAVLLTTATQMATAAAPENLETVIVTATRTPTPARAVLAPVDVIDRDALARSLAIDVTDLLRFEAGIDVARNGGPGQPTSVFIRGAESNHTLVLIDGVRMNPGTIGGAALQNIPPELIERIEIVRGPRSTLYGSDAIGGVINVITRRPAPGAHVDVQAGAGGYETREASLVTSISGAAGELGAGLTWIDSDGFPTRTTDATDRGFDNLAFSGQARTRVGSVELGVRHWQAQGTSEYSDFFLTPVDQDFRNVLTAATLEYDAPSRWRTRVTLSRMEDRIEQNDSDDHLLTERHAIDWQNDLEFDAAHRMTAGVLLQREEAESLSFGSGFDSRTRIANFYLQDSLTRGRHGVLLAGGYTDHEIFGSQPTWNAEYGVAVTASTRLTLAAGSAFRAPDATDLYGFGGNPDLEPEESVSFEVGLRHVVEEQHTLGLSAYQNDIDNLIEFVVLDPDTFEGELRNVERARIRGVEASYAFRGATWQLQAQASLQDPENRTTGALLFRRTQESFTLGIARRFGSVDLGLDVLYAGPREDFGVPEPTRLDAYTLANLTARAELSRSLSLLARVENLFDEQYEIASSYNTPDRTVFFAVRYQSE